jgi:UDP-N-acetylmuramyl pentapeptide phosphotransferase/UDP-N-acetylglucosamine-1-phosphate transferase
MKRILLALVGGLVMFITQCVAAVLMWYLGALFPATLRRYPPPRATFVIFSALVVFCCAVVIYAYLWLDGRRRKD